MGAGILEDDLSMINKIYFESSKLQTSNISQGLLDAWMMMRDDMMR